VLKAGGYDEWYITARNGNHPFHIHINPFQIVGIYDSHDVDVSATGENATDSSPIDQQYAGLKGAWKDTILVKQGYTVIMRTHYAKYVGRFVLHCHILDHEDRGMMELVQIGDDKTDPLAGKPAASPETEKVMDTIMPPMTQAPRKAKTGKM
jgi:L-ascorbate oxidase